MTLIPVHLSSIEVEVRCRLRVRRADDAGEEANKAIGASPGPVPAPATPGIGRRGYPNLRPSVLGPLVRLDLFAREVLVPGVLTLRRSGQLSRRRVARSPTDEAHHAPEPVHASIFASGHELLLCSIPSGLDRHLCAVRARWWQHRKRCASERFSDTSFPIIPRGGVMCPVVIASRLHCDEHQHEGDDWLSPVVLSHEAVCSLVCLSFRQACPVTVIQMRSSGFRRLVAAPDGRPIRRRTGALRRLHRPPMCLGCRTVCRSPTP